MVKPAPGPWKTTHSEVNGYHVSDSTGWGVAVVLKDTNDEANARLIAAAPAMLEALEAIEEGMMHDFHYVCQEWLVKNCLCYKCQKTRIKAAIAAAKRQQMNPKLKPCPFCGSDGFNHQGGVMCSNSDCFMFNACVSEKNWNNRPLENELQADIGDLNRENIGLKSILKALENIDEYKMQGHECYAKHVLLSLRDRLKRIEKGKK